MAPGWLREGNKEHLTCFFALKSTTTLVKSLCSGQFSVIFMFRYISKEILEFFILWNIKKCLKCSCWLNALQTVILTASQKASYEWNIVCLFPSLLTTGQDEPIWWTNEIIISSWLFISSLVHVVLHVLKVVNLYKEIIFCTIKYMQKWDLVFVLCCVVILRVELNDSAHTNCFNLSKKQTNKTSGWSRISREGTYYLANFPQNCMKMKKFCARGGTRPSPPPPPDPPMKTFNNDETRLRETRKTTGHWCILREKQKSFPTYTA